MAGRERLVVETDYTRKEALHAVLRDRGVTISDWFEEQLDLLLTDSSLVSPTADLRLPDLDDAEGVATAIQSLDWAFADADTSYLSHDIHPYPAKFIPQIPAQAIALTSRRGDLVLDPFGGSGTTALEALRLGRRAVSLDVNPLSELVGRVKTARIQPVHRSDLATFRSYLEERLRALSAEPTDLLQEFRDSVPKIPNIDKWFSIESRGELALIRTAANRLTGSARDIASLALSRIIVSASFQDSETRYASQPREIEVGATLRMYLAALDAVLKRVERVQAATRYGVREFITCDSRDLESDILPSESVDCIVTSPPYGNATDYHLYHRFRLFWLGFDPVAMGRVEIGSHLRHQREKSGFEEYLAELRPCIAGMARVLRPGGYALFVVGDSVYAGQTYETVTRVAEECEQLDLEPLTCFRRPLPADRRSFASPARRATDESILLVRKEPSSALLCLVPPAYTLWAYERELRLEEAEVLAGASSETGEDEDLYIDSTKVRGAKRLTFARGIRFESGHVEPTWQQILENGYCKTGSSRKDPKYATHGLHPYKGKFYPQLAKSLINLSDIEPGSLLLDPFCGSGTTLLEGYLNGYRTVGCDLNPLAAKIARTKVEILDIDPTIVMAAASAIRARLDRREVDSELSCIPEDAREEARSWFAEAILRKVNHLLSAIRTSCDGTVRDYFELLLSSLLRDVSHQDPRDLRIRRRKDPLQDADVCGMFLDRVEQGVDRLEHFWSIRGYSPFEFQACRVLEGDSREWETFSQMQLEEGSVDFILTSPPYATALPYIDTDRLSLLMLFGISSSSRRPLEHELIGSREIRVSERRALEDVIKSGMEGQNLPSNVRDFLEDLLHEVCSSDVGFRRQNKPSLLARFFMDMRTALAHCVRALKENGEIAIVIGDNSTRINGETIRIPTTDFIREVAVSLDLVLVDDIPIDVTTEDLAHIKHAITKNRVLRLRKPGLTPAKAGSAAGGEA